MFEKTIETSATPHIVVDECLGSLVVRGHVEGKITLRARDGDDRVTLDREGETFTLAARADCTLICPQRSTLTVRSVLGNLSVEEVEGPLALGVVHGNATLRDVGSVALESAFGNLSAREIAGELQGQDLKGNVRIRQVEKVLTLDQVGGNLVAEELHGGLVVDQVRGNVRLGPPFSPDASYRVSVAGNLTAFLPPDASVRLTLRAGGGVRSRISGLVLEESDGRLNGTLGGGEASLEMEAGGHVYLRGLEPAETMGLEVGLEDVGLQIEARIAEAMAEMETRLEESLGRMDSEAIRRRVESATERVRRKAEHAAERARMRAERAERRWQRVSGRRAPTREEVTGEERLRVLRMVEEGKITPEQASELLSALEGR